MFKGSDDQYYLLLCNCYFAFIKIWNSRLRGVLHEHDAYKDFGTLIDT